jgi:hypothetical protein
MEAKPGQRYLQAPSAWIDSMSTLRWPVHARSTTSTTACSPSHCPTATSVATAPATGPELALRRFSFLQLKITVYIVCSNDMNVKDQC